jgi:hypothetical protein
LFILKKSNIPLNTFLRKNTATLTITDKAPSLRAMRVIAGYDPQHHSRRKKNVGQPTPTITDKAPSLRATTRNTTAAAKKNVGQPTPTITNKAPSLRAMRVIAGYDPQHYSRRKKNVGQPTPVIAGNDPQTNKAPSLRAMRVIAGYDPQHYSRRKKNVGQPTPTITDKAPSLRAPTRNPPITTAAAKKNVGQNTSIIKKYKNNKNYEDKKSLFRTQPKHRHNTGVSNNNRHFHIPPTVTSRQILRRFQRYSGRCNSHIYGR